MTYLIVALLIVVIVLLSVGRRTARRDTDDLRARLRSLHDKMDAQLIERQQLRAQVLERIGSQVGEGRERLRERLRQRQGSAQ